jgi:uncharacterized membrane protein YccF (DUF307 family)
MSLELIKTCWFLAVLIKLNRVLAVPKGSSLLSLSAKRQEPQMPDSDKRQQPFSAAKTQERFISIKRWGIFFGSLAASAGIIWFFYTGGWYGFIGFLLGMLAMTIIVIKFENELLALQMALGLRKLGQDIFGRNEK